MSHSAFYVLLLKLLRISIISFKFNLCTLIQLTFLRMPMNTSISLFHKQQQSYLKLEINCKFQALCNFIFSFQECLFLLQFIFGMKRTFTTVIWIKYPKQVYILTAIRSFVIGFYIFSLINLPQNAWFGLD